MLEFGAQGFHDSFCIGQRGSVAPIRGDYLLSEVLGSHELSSQRGIGNLKLVRNLILRPALFSLQNGCKPIG